MLVSLTQKLLLNTIKHYLSYKYTEVKNLNPEWSRKYANFGPHTGSISNDPIGSILTVGLVFTGGQALTGGAGIAAAKAASLDVGIKTYMAGQQLWNQIFGIKFSPHALERLDQRGISLETAKNVIKNNQPFQYFHDGVLKTGYYDRELGIFVGRIHNTAQL